MGLFDSAGGRGSGPPEGAAAEPVESAENLNKLSASASLRLDLLCLTDGLGARPIDRAAAHMLC